MAKITPMLGAVFAHATSPGESKGRPKPKTRKGHMAGGTHKVTKGEGSVTQKHQQHGELATAMAPAPLSERHQMKEHAKHTMKRATEDWLSGHISTEEHTAAHARARHVLSGKHPAHFSGKSGERKHRL